MSRMTQENLLNHLKLNPFVLAPMAGITDKPFRSFMKELGTSIVVSELVSATGLRYSSNRTKKLMEFSSDQHPVGIQLFGESLEDLSFAAKEVEQMGADFVDLNFGCPVPKVVKKGAGSACLKDLDQLRRVIESVKKSVDIPVTIKVRTGWDAESMNTDQVAHIAYNEGVTWVAIHGRTRAQGYSGLSNWDYIKSIKEKSPLPILGNGDLTSPGLACERLNQSGCDGVMIGRGCLKNPLIFKQALNLKSGGQILQEEPSLKFIFDRLGNYLAEFYDERLTALQLKKFAAWYSAGYPKSSEFRKEIFQLKDIHSVKERVAEFFAELKVSVQEDTSHENFLMGGHG